MANKPWRVAYEGHDAAGREQIWVFHIKDTTPLSADLRTAHDLADLVDTWLTAKWQNISDQGTSLDDIKVTSVVDFWNGTVAEQYVKPMTVSGSLGPTDGKLPVGTCAWAKAQVAEVFKGNHGGYHSSYAEHSGWMTSSGRYDAVCHRCRTVALPMTT